MSSATSIVGTWTGYVDWGNTGSPVHNSSTVWTFNADGSWTYPFGGGRWIQNEGMVFWNFNSAPGLVYAANVTRNALDGIQGYATASPSSGQFYAVRGTVAAIAAAAKQAKEPDFTLGQK
ncbi:hypothetical protein LQR31_09885 [Chromobacterium vaccinii]|uniref:hypothetical protein n=1 Tax=Chromobacterium vaccinii TaxID=1108595 RepID=UPI001E3B01ED|nr:hypothetical protein [Chromobacterium vaccinii]MCD4484782.1 hypothetical protein [Chromobacterium vaccinii]